MLNSILKKMAFVSGFFLMIAFIGCNSDSDFSGENKKGAKIEEPEVEAAPDPGANSAEITDSADAKPFAQAQEVVANSDGTVTERFFGRIDLEVAADVDIIFAVDTSESMDTEKSYMEQNIKAFMDKLVANKSISPRVFMIGTNFNFPVLDASKFAVVNKLVYSQDALNRIVEYFNDPSVASLPLRPGATKELVVVTDDDGLKMNPTVFTNYLTQNKATLGDVHLNGFIGLPTSQNNSWCRIVRRGNTYLSINQNPEFAGELFDLCTEDWSLLFDKLAEKIFKVNAQIEFKLETVPLDPESIKVLLNGEVVPDAGWDYIAENQAIAFKIESAPKAGDLLEIIFAPKKII